MAFYHEYYISYCLQKRNILPAHLNEFYSINRLSLSEITRFFNHYEKFELIRKNDFSLKNEGSSSLDKEIKELFIKTVKKDLPIDLIKKKTQPSLPVITMDESDSKESLLLAIKMSNLERVKDLISKGIMLSEKYSNLSEIKDMELLNFLINNQMVDLKNKNTYPKLSQFSQYSYPLDLMIKNGFDINAVDISALKNCLLQVNTVNLQLQKTYSDLLKCGLNPEKRSYNKNAALFYITDENVAQLIIDRQADINHYKGTETLLTKIICDTQIKDSEVLKKRIKIVELLLINNAIFGKSKTVKTIDEKITSFSNINPIYYDLLIKYGRIDTHNLSLNIHEIEEKNSFFDKLIAEKKISINNFEFGYLSSGRFITGSFRHIERKLGKERFNNLVSNLQDKNSKSVNGCSFMEQCIFERRIDLLDNFKSVNPVILMDTNSIFAKKFGINEGKVTVFTNIESEELYDWLKKENLLKSKAEYSLNEIEEISYDIGVKLYKDGFLKDEIINPLIINSLDCRKGTLKIYAIENNNLGKMKDINGKNLLCYCSNPKLAKFLLGSKSITITEKIDDYPVVIRHMILNKLKSLAHKEKELIISVIEQNDNTYQIEEKKRRL